MKLTLLRTHLVGPKTFGKLYADGRWLCYVLEDKVREIPGRPPEEWKLHGQTAIPQGEYSITLEESPRFGPRTLTVNGVPGFKGVRMHAGNTEADTEGCPLLGMAINDGGIVGGTSRPAVDLVKRVVSMALDAGELVTLEISNPVQLA